MKDPVFDMIQWLCLFAGMAVLTQIVANIEKHLARIEAALTPAERGPGQ